MSTKYGFGALLLFGFLFQFSSGCKHDPVPLKPKPVDTICFELEILPIIITNCASLDGCHTSNSPAEGVILTNYSNIMEYGEIEAGNPDGSKLYEVITEDDVDERMPFGGDPLGQTDIDLIRKWIEQGAMNTTCDDDCDTNLFTFSGQVQPILNERCISCHTGAAAYNGIELTDFEKVMAAVDAGKLPGVLRGNPVQMPPSGAMDECRIRVIEKWIENGAQNN